MKMKKSLFKESRLLIQNNDSSAKYACPLQISMVLL